MSGVFLWEYERSGTCYPLSENFDHVEAIWEKERKPSGDAFPGGILTEQAGSKCVQVKGVMLLLAA